MNLNDAVANDDLIQLLAEPESAPRRTGRFLFVSSHAIRVCVTILDAAQVVVIAMAMRELVPGMREIAWQTFDLALMVAALAAITRRALRVGTAVNPDSLTSVSLRAAFAVAIAMIAVIVCAQAAKPLEQDEALVVLAWCMVWGGLSTALAYSVRHGAHALSERLGHASPAVAVIDSDKDAHLPVAAPKSVVGSYPSWRVAACVGDTDQELNMLARLAQNGQLNVVVVMANGPGTAAIVSKTCARLADQPVRICLALHTISGVDGFQPAPRLGGLPLFDLRTRPHQGWPGTIKRTTETLLAGAALIALAPLFAAVAFAIRLETPGSPLFAQWRFGQGSRPVRIWKFRTMYSGRADATGGQRTRASDPRVTRVGRFLRRSSIDELPQLLNVVRGEMSLVGPRPHPLHMRVDDAYYFDAVQGYRVRHSVKPGLTGWAQINGSRGEIDTLAKARKRVELDLWYLDNWSLALDATIVLRTALGGFLTKAD